ncbi:hypothetical protein GCK32_004928, partial [Trichostrongylus colubriformis]
SHNSGTLDYMKHEFFYPLSNYAQPECREWPVRSPSPIRQCTICSAPSNGYHFNAPSCSACAAFFRRTVTLGRQFLCAHQGNCKVHFEKMHTNDDEERGGEKKKNPPALSPDTPSYSSSISEEHDPLPHSLKSLRETGEDVLEMLLREERLYNERRSILYCVKSSISEILSAGEVNDIKILLRRCTLFHPIIDPCYLTMRLGLPDRFVMFNGMYAGIAIDSEEGWRDETCISATLKKELYRPLLDRVLADIVRPMQTINISFVEYVILKALVTFKSTLSANISSSLKRCLTSQIDFTFTALSTHYATLGMSSEDVAVRTGNVILLIGNIFEVGMQCLESHQVIQFFDLWKLDDLLIKLISESLQP